MATNLSLEQPKDADASYNTLSQGSPSNGDDTKIPIDSPVSLGARATTYRGINPWQGRKLNCWDYFKIAFHVLTGLVLIKVILLLILALLCWMFASLTVAGLSDKDLRSPLPCWRRFCRYMVRLTIRGWLFTFGFYWIWVNKPSKSRKRSLQDAQMLSVRSNSGPIGGMNTSTTDIERKDDSNNNSNYNNTSVDNIITDNNDLPVISDDLQAHCIVCNHHSAFDGFILFCIYGAAAVAKQELGSIPVAGAITRATQAILVDRINRDGRKKAVKDIEQHIKNYDLPPLVLFPQATCSNINAITTFKVGAFIPGLPLKPVALNFHNNKFTDWSFVGESIGWEIFYSMCQFINYVSVEECEDYFPSKNEMEDARLFAENVRKEVAKRLPDKVKVTPHSFDDFILVKKIGRATRERKMTTPEVNDVTKHFVVEDVSRLLQFKVRTVTKLADRFSYYDKNQDGQIDYEEFCLAFERSPESINMHKLFRALNTKRRHLKTVEFEEFLAGISVCFIKDYIDDALRVMFDICNYSNEQLSDDENDIANEYITYEWVMDTIEKNFGDKIDDDDNKNNNNGDEKHTEKEPNKYIKKQEEEIALARSKFDKAKKEALKKLTPMIKDLFENKEEKLSFEQFTDRMMPHYAETCQVFLQTMICAKLGIQLTSADFIEPSNVNLTWDWTRFSSVRTVSIKNGKM